MKHNALLILFILYATISTAQTKINGTVLSANNGKPVDVANVIVQDVKKTGIYLFTITNDNGNYAIQGNFNTDSLAITVTAMNIETTTKLIKNISGQVDFKVKCKVTEIKEVIVKSTIPAVKRFGDTLTYIAAKYIDANDLVAEDIIKKLPGVEVNEAGKISYQGKDISKFYIEGLDMLGPKYAVASKNIDVKDIHSINIYENHQPVRALKKLSTPDAAAMNITLKDGAKGTWTGSILAGGGFEPWMWKGEATAMYFGKNMQSLNTYKTNNTGDNVAIEFAPQYEGINSSKSIIGVQLPTIPPLDENLYLDNQIQALSSNILFKLSETTQVSFNSNFAHDLQKSEGISSTVHNIIGAAPIIIDEVTYAGLRSNTVNLDLGVENNKDKNYLNNTLSFNGNFNKDYGSVISNGEQVEQSFKLPSLTARNKLDMIIPAASKFSLRLISDMSYNNQPTSLKIKPMLFPEIFGLSNAEDAVQRLHSSKFFANNSVYTSYQHRNWGLSLNAGFNAHAEQMTSELYTVTQPIADSMRNDIDWQRYDFIVGSGISYRLNNDFFVRADISADFMALKSKDKIRGITDNISKVIAKPSLSLNGRITQDLKYSASAVYSEYYGGIYDLYGGFIMTDYRNIATKDGQLRHTKNQNYSASLNYSNALKLIFANIQAAYRITDNNLLYDYKYDNALTYIETVATPNRSQGYTLSGKFSKYFLGISTMISVGGDWNHSLGEIMRQGKLLNTTSDLYSTILGFNTRFTKWLTMDYEVTCRRSVNDVEALDKITPVDYIKQEGELLLSLGKKTTASVDCEHFYNSVLSEKSRNMVFLGAQLRYKTSKIVYSLEGKNLLGTRSYSSAFTSDITEYSYSYALRPRAIIITIRYNY